MKISPRFSQIIVFISFNVVILACNGVPSVEHHLTGNGPLEGLDSELDHCLSMCTAIGAGTGCKAAPSCAAFCDDAATTAIGKKCLSAANALWKCSGSQNWTCAGGLPDLVDPAKCAAETTAYNTCTGGAVTTGPVKDACDQWCTSQSLACTPAGGAAIDPKCSPQCATDANKDLPAKCATAAVDLVTCNAHGKWTCAANVAAPPATGCEAETAAVAKCKKDSAPKDVSAALKACNDACGSIAKMKDCKAFGEGGCLDKCTDMAAKLPVKCIADSVARWNCAAKAEYTCVAGLGSSLNCGTEVANLNACIKTGDQLCNPTQYSCDGDKLMQCSPDGQAIAFSKDCAQSGKTCKSNACVGVPCSVSGLSCDGDKVIECSGGEKSIKADCSLSQKLCVKDHCEVKNAVCKPGETKCDGEALLQCASDGSDYKSAKCPNSTQNCKHAGCVASTQACGMVPDVAGTACVSFNQCLAKAACDGAGKCTGQPKVCDDKAFCTIDSCDVDKGCVFSPDSGLCSDGNPCSVDACIVGKDCIHEVLGGPATCSGVMVGNVCYYLVNGNYFGAAQANCNNGCTNGELCTTGGQLAKIESKEANDVVAGLIKQKYISGGGAWIGARFVVDQWLYADDSPMSYANWDINQPTAAANFNAYMKGTGLWYSAANDKMSASGGACSKELKAACDDGNACTVGDQCDMTGLCKAGKGACDDKNPCTVDSCVGKEAFCSNVPAAKGFACDDGNVCTVGDACDGVSLCKSATPNTCDDANSCTLDSCSEPAGCSHVGLPVPITCGDAMVCIGTACKAAGTCGDSAVNGLGEQCDDGNTKNGDGCDSNCQYEAKKSCTLILQAFPNAANMNYPIDPDGAGPLPAVSLFCDMSGGGWTMVANIYDSIGNDVPDLPQDVTAGWQQTGSGVWGPVASVSRDSSGMGSSAVGLDFVVAMSAWATKNIRLCLVAKNGLDGACVTSPTSLKLAGSTDGDALLDGYSANKLAWTFGRLVGLPGTTDKYDPSLYKSGKSCVEAEPTKANEFGVWCENSPKTVKPGFCESNDVGPVAVGSVWCSHCDGLCFRPQLSDDSELGVSANPPVNNPGLSSWGFRLYVGP